MHGTDVLYFEFARKALGRAHKCISAIRKLTEINQELKVVRADANTATNNSSVHAPQ